MAKVTVPTTMEPAYAGIVEMCRSRLDVGRDRLDLMFTPNMSSLIESFDEPEECEEYGRDIEEWYPTP